MSILKEKIKEIINISLERAIRDNKLESRDYPPVVVEYPKEEKYGDYATPFSLTTAKALRRSPIEIGNIIKEYLDQSEVIDRVEVVKPGFINLFLSLDFLYEILLTILRDGENYGKNKKNSSKRINIEFVSANPTGPLNIVSARAAAIGDTLANLLEASGCIVDREYYINDFGNQVYILGKSVLYRYREIIGQKIDFPDDGYHGEYIREIAEYIGKNYQNNLKDYSSEEDLIDFLALKAIEYNVSRQKEDLEGFNVKFNSWFSERSLHEKGSVQRALERLESSGVVYLKDDKKIFKAASLGDDKDRVLVKSDGNPTYFLADIAYHLDKIDRGYNCLIDIWGPDHHGYIARLVGALKAIGINEDSLVILIAQQVNLIMDGETVKMSKRLGKFSTMYELIDEIGIDVTRYFFVMRSMESHLDFDLVLAKRQSSENPVFYLQYAHARICSIFREAEKRGIEYKPSESDIDFLNNPEAISLLKLMARFPEEVFEAANSFEPHRIANYLLKLAKFFHKFYTEHRVILDNKYLTNTNLTLCDGVRIVLRNGLKLLGVSAPESM